MINRNERASWSKRTRAFVKAIEDAYELSEAEQVIMVSLARAMTREDALTEAMADEALAITNRFGELVNHPHVTELRQLGGLIAKLVGGLRLPDVGEDGTQGKTPQRRSQPRGTYSWNPSVVG